MNLLGFRPAFWPTVCTVPMLMVLIALGTWQVQRLHWKTALIATMEQRLAMAPVELPAGGVDPDDWAYRRVRVSGRFDYGGELHMVANSQHGALGYQIFTPLDRPATGDWVLVNRGWVPAKFKDPATRAEGQVAGRVTVEGLVRPGRRQARFVPDNDPARNVWFYPDLRQMAAALGRPVPALFVEAGPAPNPGGLPVGGQTRVRIRNMHLEYAITWYGLAVALAVIYVVWHRRRGSTADPA